ncbi:lytic murein transglycosylase [Pseudolabrys taiwanensis]|uniref:Lytic murein transglycosylase n=1 Tax=Pseudolabrys taiwanensis TaxID=331696 RepID=A0A345ZTS6_9HYPH|nr:lytic murein transglycosylase [Pseudolabrys taiwanensis]AXK80323.1 lytic murein transglycosylase [Pseudolabrys taiwanensis]
MTRISRLPSVNRRTVLGTAIAAGLTWSVPAWARSAAFERWVQAFRARAIARGISEETYDRVMGRLEPDTAVYEQFRKQPEFTEQTWQYINRRCSDWRVITGKQRAKEHASLLARVEKDYGVDRYVLLGLWGMESSYGDVIDNPKYMRPIIPSLAALAYGEPRRRKYWESELLNALLIVDRKWAQPSEMIGSWAGAMGHTQWMPEVWLHVGVDYDRDGRINPFGKPDDALAGTARYLVERGKWRRGEAWGYEVKIPAGHARLANNRTWRSYAKWHELGVTRADGAAFPRPHDQAKLWLPVAGGPAFLVGPNFRAVYSYNPSSNYTLALVHLGDLIRGNGGFRQHFPGGERIPTIDEVKEIQRRLNEQGFKTDGIDGRTGSDTVRAIVAFQKKNGIDPDGYAGLKLLAQLRQMR